MTKYYSVIVDISTIDKFRLWKLIKTEMDSLRIEDYYIKITARDCVYFSINGINDLKLCTKIVLCLRNHLNLAPSIEEDYRLKIFSTVEEYRIYRKWNIILDKIFRRYYFSRTIDWKQIILFIELCYIDIMDEELFLAHFSHFWGFFMSLNARQSEYIFTLMKERVRELEESCSFLDRIDFNQLKVDIEFIMENNRDFDFFSPNDLEKLIENDMFASKIHELTWKNELMNPKLRYNSLLISNKWFLNIIYEKFPMLEIRMLDKFTINYHFSNKYRKYDINKSLENYLNTGIERLI
ncbi:hypothetical protein [Streptococcus acidominimus]|uniref:Uncharacterized protein n=1 Tax=Streptococcus acidominimus TaxID=1326 RepID=A0A1Q8EBA3_STRAI|nr:hypothetical protein [Streptococcus acidominimus]OLF49074.1 hypothetical protein BU200_09285 [Streptococcus acidominimus]SUN06815.1 Uncharacterised protein [Streptococcus acidominimus]